MYYMNTNRDNFHDWARDKPDTTSFSNLQQIDYRVVQQPGVRWGRVVMWIVLAVALIAAIRYFVRS
jgi:hypothetical protein